MRNNKRLLWQLPFLAFLIVGTVVIVSRQRSTPYQHDKGMVFGTVYHITYQSSRNLQKDIEAELAKVDASLSPFNKRSIITAVNQNRDTVVNKMFADVFTLAMKISDVTDGAFDITIGSVSLLWDFVNAVKPTDEEIAEGLKHIDYTQVVLDGTTVTMGDPEARLDLGGIAKGWIAARLVDKLEQAGCTSGLVDLGTSSVYAIGSKPDGSPWRVGLRDPNDSMSSLAGVVEICDEAITSSGLYDQEFELDGQKYWHILDPKTGYPAQTDMLGVTLIGTDPMQGDALPTTLSVMGIEEGSAWVEKNHPEIAAMFVDQSDEATFANGFESHGYMAVKNTK